MKDVIQLHDKKFRVMIPAAKIDEAVQAVADRNATLPPSRKVETNS